MIDRSRQTEKPGKNAETSGLNEAVLPLEVLAEETAMSPPCAMNKASEVGKTAEDLKPTNKTQKAEFKHANLVVDVILTSAPEGVLVLDRNARILAFNKAAETMFGYKAEEVVGLELSHIMGETPSGEGAKSSLLQAKGASTAKHHELTGKRKGGEVFPLELSIGAGSIGSESTSDEVQVHVCILRELSAKKQMEERLNSMQRQLVQLSRVNAMDEVGSAVAHELNQPLTALMLYMQALQKRGEGLELDDTFKSLLQKATREVERSSQILNSMRDFGRMREPQRKNTDILRLVDEAIELTFVGYRFDAVSVSKAYPDEIAPMEVDPVQIQQVLINLLRNAIEAVQQCDEQWINVAVKVGENNLLISVQDSGVGISTENRDKIFKTFVTTKENGMGLGLAISKIIIQSHGGDLDLECGGEAEGCGATFTINLPLKNRFGTD